MPNTRRSPNAMARRQDRTTWRASQHEEIAQTDALTALVKTALPDNRLHWLCTVSVAAAAENTAITMAPRQGIAKAAEVSATAQV